MHVDSPGHQQALALRELAFRDWWEGPRLFTTFCELIGVTLTPGQFVVARVAFDGVDPIDLPPEQREIALVIFGAVDRFPANVRGVVVAVCGARGGKTYTFVALRLLHLAFAVNLDQLAPGEQGSGIIVAPDLRLAGQAMRYVHGAIRHEPSLLVRVDGDLANERIVLDRPDGKKAAIECLPATRGGSALRGRSLFGAAGDEGAFFRGNDSVVNDEEVYKALAPRIITGGQLIWASTPWAESGMLFQLHDENHGHPRTAISVHAPTLVIHDDEHTREYVARERARDPDNAEREFDAIFMSSGSSDFFASVSVDAAVVRDIPSDGPCVASADFAFEHDACALVIDRVIGLNSYTVCVDEVQPKPGEPLKPSEVAARFAATCKRFGVSSIVGDQHYREAMREHLGQHGIRFIEAPEGYDAKQETYTLADKRLREGRAKVIEHDLLIRQIKAVKKKPLTGGGIRIFSPRKANRHGDIMSAWVLNQWQASKRLPEPAGIEVAVTGRQWTRRR